MKKISLLSPTDCRRPRIDYPCPWEYRIIGESRIEIGRAVAEHIGDRPHTLTPANVSSGGRYVSMNLEVTVHSDAQRIALYHLLAGHPAVRVVL